MQTTDYLYHKQHPEKKSRRRAGGQGAHTPKGPSTRDAVERAMATNIRTFSIVTGTMLLLLFIAIYISRKSWEMRLQEIKTESKKAKVEAGAPPAVKPDLDTGKENAPAQRAARSPLNTDEIRKAVFLAKRGKALADSGQLKEAIKRYRDALDVWPYLTEGWAQIGRLYLDTKQYPRAQIALERAVENEPGSPDILNDLAVAHLYQNRVDKALELFQAATEIDPTFAPSYFNIALCYLSKDNRADAEDMLNQYLRLRPRDPRALKERAYMQASDGDYKAALKTLKKALMEAPEWPPIYFDAAAAAALLGRVEDALKYLDKAEALTSPETVYQVFQQPAFKEIRLSELGRLFEQDIAERAKDKLASVTNAAAPQSVIEPLSSTTPTP